MYIYIYAYVCVYIYICVCVCAYVYVYIYIRIYIYGYCYCGIPGKNREMKFQVPGVRVFITFQMVKFSFVRLFNPNFGL